MKKFLLLLLIAGTAHAQLEQNVKLRQFNIAITGTPTLVTTPLDVNIKSGNFSIIQATPTPTGSATPTFTPTYVQPVYVIPATGTPNGTQVPLMLATAQAQNTIIMGQLQVLINAVATMTPVVNVSNQNTPIPQFTQIPNATPNATILANASYQLTQIAIAQSALTPWVNQGVSFTGGVWYTTTPNVNVQVLTLAQPTPTAQANVYLKGDSVGLSTSANQVSMMTPVQNTSNHATTIDTTVSAIATVSLTQVSLQLTQVALALTPQVPQDSKTFAFPVSITLAGAMTDAIVAQLYNPVGSGVTLRINQSTLNSNVQNLVFVLGRGTSPVTVAGSCTPVAVTVTSYSTSVSSSAAATQYLSAQPTPPATTAIFGYGDTGSSYNPVQWPYMFNLYAQRMMIKPGESFFVRVSGTSSSGIIYGFVLYSEQ